MTDYFFIFHCVLFPLAFVNAFHISSVQVCAQHPIIVVIKILLVCHFDLKVSCSHQLEWVFHVEWRNLSNWTRGSLHSVDWKRQNNRLRSRWRQINTFVIIHYSFFVFHFSLFFMLPRDYLLLMWLSPKETDSYLLLVKLGPQPASVVSRHLGSERTSTYKMLLQMVKRWLLAQTKKSGVLFFFVASLEHISPVVTKQKTTADCLVDELPNFLEQCTQLKHTESSFAPQMTMYDGGDGMRRLTMDILTDITTNGYRVIKFFSSHTFDSYAYTPQTLGQYYGSLFTDLTTRGVMVETWTWQGISLMETMLLGTSPHTLLDIPAGNNTVNIFVVWQAVYYAVFDTYPAGLKIASKALANAMHFLFEHMKE